jgi:hypothetical protein
MTELSTRASNCLKAWAYWDRQPMTPENIIATFGPPGPRMVSALHNKMPGCGKKSAKEISDWLMASAPRCPHCGQLLGRG